MDEIMMNFGGVSDLIDIDHDLERFLLCSPFSNNAAYNYNNILTEDVFFDQLYVYGDAVGKTIKDEMVDLITFGRKKTIFLLGNKGCGKTTFVHRVKKTFDDQPNIRSVFLDFGDSSATLTINKAKEKLIQSIYKMMRTAISDNNINLLKSLLKTYDQNESEFEINWDFHNNIDGFFETVKDIMNNDTTKLLCALKHKARPYMAKMELFQLFLLLVLFDQEKQKQEGANNTVYIFDNLDNMPYIEDISVFIENYCNFQNNIDALLKAIYGNNNANFMFLFVMRETTKAGISPHSLEMMHITTKEYDITSLFSKKDVILKRIGCYRKYLLQKVGKKAENEEKWTVLEHLEKIITDPYMHKTIFPFYNYDYRICTSKLVRMCRKNSELTKQYVELIKGDENAKFGGRGIIYRILFSDLQSKGYFRRLMLVDFNSRERKASLSRILLTYLSNKTNTDSTDESPSVSLAELFEAFPKVDRAEIVECIWAMFDLINAADWNHLVTYASSKKVSKDHLFEEVCQYENSRFNNNDSEYSKFRITCAGEVYLSNVCTHYEFFSCRTAGNRYFPLFAKENIQLEDGQYRFQYIMENVFLQVKECCRALNESYESGLCSNPDPPYNYRNANIYQYHSERIIFSHISYLEAFRIYLLRNYRDDPDLNLDEISLFILSIIKKYCGLFGASAKCAAKKTLSKINENLSAAEEAPSDSNITVNRRDRER